MSATQIVSLYRCECGGIKFEDHKCGCNRHVEVREYVPLDDVMQTLEYAYAPQNPTVHHPADWIAQHYGKAPGVVPRKLSNAS